MLTKAQLIEVTGYKQAAKQKEQLAAMGIPFSIKGGEKPIVSREAFLEVLGKKRKAPNATKKAEPNLFEINPKVKKENDGAKTEIE